MSIIQQFEKSGVDTEALKRELRGLDRSRFKAASIGGEQEAGFEQAFASLAYAYIKDKAPRLLDFLVGFQLVDRNEDNTKAMGVFGFKVSAQWLYAPVFFLNGDLKGHEMLYVKKTDSFVPMKENWINYILSKKPHILGEPSPRQPHELGQLLPQLSQLSVPPRNNKFASTMPEMHDWAVPALSSFAKLMLTDGEKFAAIVQDGMPLLDNWKGVDDLLRQDLSLLKGAYDLYRKYPGIKAGVDKFYGGTQIFHVIGNEMKKAAAAKPGQTYILPPPAPKAPEAPKPPKAPEAPKAPPVGKAASIIPYQVKESVGRRLKITVNNDVVTTENLPDLDEEEREKLLNDPVLIKDHREGEEISKAYNVEIQSELINPDRTRRYEVLTAPGKFEKLLVIHQPHSGRGYEPWSTVLKYEGDDKGWLNVHSTEVWCRPGLEEDNSEEYREWYESLPKADSLSVDSTYVVLARNGQGTVPFTVKEDLGDQCYKVSFHDEAVKRRALGLADHRDDKDRGYDPVLNDYHPWDAKVCLNTREGSRIKSYNGLLYLPTEARLIKVKSLPKPKKDEHGCVVEPVPIWGAGDHIPLCNLADVQNEIIQKTARLKLYEDHSEVIIDSPAFGTQRMPKLAGLIHLVRDHGFDETTARELMKQAAVKGLAHGAAVFRVAYGPEYPLKKEALVPGGMGGNMIAGAPGAPALPEAEYGYDQTFGGAPTQYQSTEFMPVPGMESDMTDPDIYNPNNVPDPMAVQYGQEAAGRGQKQVFDTAMLGQMLKAVREDSIVDRYLGDLLKALDRLGRILFMFYWHQEEFQERYGKADLPELEDSIRNAFEVLGDVVLYLKKKTIDTEFQGMGIEEPDVEEAAM